MAYTQSDIDALKQAMATGAKRVRFQTHETEFRSLDEMERQLAAMERSVNPEALPVRRTVAKFYR